MQTIKLEFIRFIKNKRIVFSLLAFLAYLLVTIYQSMAYFWFESYDKDVAARFFNHSLQLTYPLFIIFLFIAYDFFEGAKRHELLAVLKATKKSSRLLYFSEFVVLLAALLFFVVAITAVNLFTALHIGFTLPAYIYYLIKVSFYYCFLVPVLAIVLAAAVAKQMERTAAYATLVGLAFLFSGIVQKLLHILNPGKSDTVANFFTYFNLFPYGTKTPYFSDVLLPFRLLNHFRLLALFSFALALFLWNRRRMELLQKVCFVALAVLSIISFMAFFRYDSPLMPYDTRTRISDYDYYNTQVQVEGEATPFWPEAKLERVRGTLVFHDRLEAQLTYKFTIQEESNELPEELVFTLYHGYTISDIQVNNEEISYRQEGDHLILSFEDFGLPKEGASFTVDFIYQGAAPLYYTGPQSTCLAGYFAYMPRPGEHVLFDLEKRDFLALPFAEPCQFELKIKGAKRVFSNLQEQEPSLFVGVSNGPSFFAGFYQEELLEGIRIIRPSLLSDDFEAKLQTFVQEIQLEQQFVRGTEPCLIYSAGIINRTPELQAAFLSDHLLVTSNLVQAADAALKQRITPEKRPLYDWLKVYDTELFTFFNLANEFAVIEARPENAQSEEAKQQAMSKTYLIQMIELAKHMTPQHFREAIMTYLLDKESDLTPTEFLDVLLEAPVDSEMEEVVLDERTAEIFQILDRLKTDSKTFYEELEKSRKRLLDEINSPHVKEEIKVAHRKTLANHAKFLWYEARNLLGEEALIERANDFIRSKSETRDSLRFLYDLIRENR